MHAACFSALAAFSLPAAAVSCAEKASKVRLLAAAYRLFAPAMSSSRKNLLEASASAKIVFRRHGRLQGEVQFGR